MKYFVYKYVYHNDVIYVGKTDNMKRRVDEHASGQGLEAKFLPYLHESDIYFHECCNEVEMSALERLLINQYKPILNVKDVTAGDSTVTIEIDWQYYIETTDRRYDILLSELNQCKKTIASHRTRIQNYEDTVRKLRKKMASLLPFYKYLEARCDEFICQPHQLFRFRESDIPSGDCVQIGEFAVDKWYDVMEPGDDIIWIELSGELLQKLCMVKHRPLWIKETMDIIGENQCRELLYKVSNLQRKIGELSLKQSALEAKIKTAIH